MNKDSIYYAADGTKFSSITEKNKYDNTLQEKENKEDEEDSSSLFFYYFCKIYTNKNFDFLSKMNYNIIRKEGRKGRNIQ